MLVCTQADWRSTQKKQKKDGDKSAVAFLKDARQLGCVFQDTEPPESLPYARAQKSWDQFDECDSQKLHSVLQTFENTKVRRSEKFKSKFLISAVSTQWNLRIDLRRKLKDRSDVSAETREDLSRISWSTKKRTKLPSSHPAPSVIKNRRKENML